MSEHKTGKSNYSDDQKRAYRSMRENHVKQFRFTMHGFSYKDGPTTHVGKTEVTKKAFRKMTRRARRFIGASE